MKQEMAQSEFIQTCKEIIEWHQKFKTLNNAN